MGGYGAMKLALAHPDRYGAAASIFGALDLAAHIHDEWSDSRARAFEAVFGDLSTLPGSGNDLVALLQSLTSAPDTAFYVCCGTEDYLYQDSITFRDTALEKGLAVTYEESPGEHEWGFCDAYIQRILEWLPIEPLKSPYT